LSERNKNNLLGFDAEEAFCAKRATAKTGVNSTCFATAYSYWCHRHFRQITDGVGRNAAWDMRSPGAEIEPPAAFPT
jgi:hypothetical protein